MEQSKASRKSYLKTVKDMPTAKKIFLGAATIFWPFFSVFLYSENLNLETLALEGPSALVVVALSVGSVALGGVTGLIVLTLKEYLRNRKNGDKPDPLQIAFIVAAILTLFIGDAVFAGLSAASGVVLIAITVIRERKNGDENRENASLGRNKPNGLL